MRREQSNGAKNNDSTYLNAWRRAESDTAAMKRTILAKFQLYSKSLPKKTN
jgi:hypothetical protein